MPNLVPFTKHPFLEKNMENIIFCGPRPYLMGQKLTCRGYELLKAKRVSIQRYGRDALSLQLFNRKSLIGMTGALRHKLDVNEA